MDPYSRLQSDRLVGLAHLHQWRQEAITRRLVQEAQAATSWRTQLANQLHKLAERIEPSSQPEVKGSIL